jgi:hypothetical protein
MTSISSVASIGTPTVTSLATSYESKALEFAMAMFAASTTWAAICDESAPALSKVVLIDGGDKAVTGEEYFRNQAGDTILEDPPFATISMQGPIKETELGVGVYQRTGTVAIGLTIMAPREYHPAQASVWATNIIGNIKKEIKDQQGTSGKLAKVEVNSEPMTILEGTGANAGAFQTIITINWRA